MKRNLFIIGIVVLLATVSTAVIHSLLYVYDFVGQVKDADDGSGIVADGHTVVLYKSDNEVKMGIYSKDTVGSTAPGRYAINAFSSKYLKLVPGEKVKVAVVRDDKNYGAGPVEATCTGSGYELVGDMTMAYGAGIDLFGPHFKEIWFNNRMYHTFVMTQEGAEFVTNATPRIRAYLESAGVAGLDANRITIAVNEGDVHTMTAAEISNKTFMAAAPEILESLMIEYSIPADDPLIEKKDEGDVNTVTFRAWDAAGMLSTTEVCKLTVLGGPSRIIGPVYIYPSPYSPSKDPQCEITYTLSSDTDLEIYLYSIAGELVKQFRVYAGQEGGSAGYNKVVWDGRNTSGLVVGNGIYTGSIFDKAQNKKLAAFKLAIVH
jgi:hypothetical protein